MSRVKQRRADVSIVSDRAFVRCAPDGLIDGEHERGVYADDLRLLRRIEVWRAEGTAPLASTVAISPTGCAVCFEVPRVEPGAGVLLSVELDGTDLFTVRRVLVEAGDLQAGSPTGLSLGEARPDARVRLEATCRDASLEERDGVALADAPVAADGTARTASWRWRVPADADGPMNLSIELRASWALSSDEQPPVPRGFTEIDGERRAAVRSWLDGQPSVEGVRDITAVINASVNDLASLRISTESGHVLAAGVPWFLTVFGRDALLAAWMTLPLDPTIAAATLRHLAATQASEYDLATDAEPGKIIHEERRGVAARRFHERYYGSVDSTPLFLMLLAETLRWTGDTALAKELEQPARRAVAWLQARIEEDELGLLSYWRRAERGLDVQSWKDSPDSQRDHAGRIARGRIRPLEAQGYAVAALRGVARVAAVAWDDDVAGSEWAADARLLERRIIERFRVELTPGQLDGEDDPRAGGFLAQALDADGAPLDALCSNMGHLLWTDALPDPVLRSRVLAQLSDPALDSGWGIRTMSTYDAGYDPASYHCGSVWPHDTTICIAGIAKYDRPLAARLGRDLFEAATGGANRLPEHFDGTPRSSDASGPTELESACSPQAWAAASPLLLLRVLLGLEPDTNGSQLVSTITEAPEWLHGLEWNRVHALGYRWNVKVGKDGIVDVVRAIG
ncbi:MAG: hypothetical protein JWM86_2895 [Thermoleophilia bacterium]|nr:hypothetical protein [Thermoleophilia bacterium]